MTRAHNILSRLLRRNLSRGQLALYLLAAFLGLSIVMCAWQIYRNVASQHFQGQYLTLSHRTSALKGLLAANQGFSVKEIKALQRQPWVRKVGVFEASQFDVALTARVGDRGFSTALFFEAVPDEFLDIIPQEWHFDPEHPQVPIVLPREYLALYNYGFAPARGLPQVTPAVIQQLPLRVLLSGPDAHQMWLPAHVAGFSSRLNTIAVPGDFLRWANNKFAGADASSSASRLIVEVSRPGDPAIDAYLRNHNLELSGGDAHNQFASTLRWTIGIMIGVGGVILSLALVILTLSIFLLIQKTRSKLRDLRALGYSVWQLASRYFGVIALLNLICYLASAALLLILQHMGTGQLLALGFLPASPIPVLLWAALFITLLTLADLCLLRRLVARL